MTAPKKKKSTRPKRGRPATGPKGSNDSLLEERRKRLARARRRARG